MSTRKKTLAILALIFTSFFVFAGTSGSGKTLTENRNLNSFNAVELHIPANVSITHGNQNLQLSADDNLLSEITTQVTGNTLKITTKSNVNFKSPVEFAISLPDIKRVAIHGSGTFQVDAIDGPEFSVVISGSGRVAAAGRANTAHYEISGSGAIDTKQLTAQKTSANISGSGNIHMGETDELTSKIAGSGTITYSGDPSVESQIYGSGRVLARR